MSLSDSCYYVVCKLFLVRYGDYLDLHVLTHSFHTRLFSDLPFDAASQALGGAGSCGGIDLRLPPFGGDRGDRFEHMGQARRDFRQHPPRRIEDQPQRSEEHTSELQSLMRISYAVFCLKQKKYVTINITTHTTYMHESI